LSNLIIDQGTLLDSIEYNIEQTAVDVEEASVQLKVAEGYQKRTGRRYCILLLVLLIILATTVLVIKIQRSGRAKQMAPPTTPSNGAGIAAIEPGPVIVTPEEIGGRDLGLFDELGRPRILSRIMPRNRRIFMQDQRT
jgi:hypothetical protein